MVAGTFTTVNGASRSGVARLLPDGTALMAADFPSPSPGLVRCLADGRRDPFFQPGIELRDANGLALPPKVHSITVDGRLRIWITRDFTRVGGLPRAGVARLHPDGRVDPSFTPGVEYQPWTANSSSLVPSPDGSICLVGGFHRPGELWPHARTRLAPSAPPAAAVIALDANGHLRVRLSTTPGIYDWQRAAALSGTPRLSVIRTNLATGVFEFTDPAPATDAAMFFRLVPVR